MCVCAQANKNLRKLLLLSDIDWDADADTAADWPPLVCNVQIKSNKMKILAACHYAQYALVYSQGVFGINSYEY